jgi:hypothetical protein
MRKPESKTLLTETSSRDRYRSTRYCQDRFSPYGIFATIPLSIALLRDGEFEPTEFGDILYNTYTSETIYFYVPEAPRKCLERLEFEDAAFFTLQDYCLLFRLVSSPPNPRTDELEQDRCELLQQMERPTRMLKNHAQTLLKAVDFWKSRYNSKLGLWPDELKGEYQQWRTHGRPGEENVDEGYSSRGSRVLCIFGNRNFFHRPAGISLEKVNGNRAVACRIGVGDGHLIS